MRPNIRHVKDITSKKVEQAMLKMKTGKAAGPSRVLIEVIRIC